MRRPRRTAPERAPDRRSPPNRRPTDAAGGAPPRRAGVHPSRGDGGGRWSPTRTARPSGQGSFNLGRDWGRSRWFRSPGGSRRTALARRAAPADRIGRHSRWRCSRRRRHAAGGGRPLRAPDRAAGAAPGTPRDSRGVRPWGDQRAPARRGERRLCVTGDTSERQPGEQRPAAMVGLMPVIAIALRTRRFLAVATGLRWSGRGAPLAGLIAKRKGWHGRQTTATRHQPTAFPPAAHRQLTGNSPAGCR